MYKAAKDVYALLPDTRKERNLARSTFERKLNMPKSANNTVTSNRSPKKFLVDNTNAAQKSIQQRSMTASRQLGISSSKKRVPKMSMSRSPYLDKIQVCFRASAALNNTALNAWGYGTVLAVASAGTDISVAMTQLTALGALFREFRCLRLDIDFVPRVGSTAAGVIAVAVDRDPRTGTPGGISDVIRRDPFFEVDIKQPGNLTWQPITEDDRRWRYTNDASRPIEFLSHGTIVGWSVNDQALAALIGELFYNGWFEFAVPN